MRRNLIAALAALCLLAFVGQALATACSVSSKADKSTGEYTFSNADKANIIERHNFYKAHVPVAVDDMQFYTWNTDLERNARVWAKKCFWGHSEQSCRANIAGNAYNGENIASGYGSKYEPTASPGGFITMTESWANERQYFSWASNTCASGQMCGHYTQMVWHTSNQVGCAMVNCPAGTIFGAASWFLVCQYGPGGNYNGELPAHVALNNPCAQGFDAATSTSRCGAFGTCVMSGTNWHCDCEVGYTSGPTNQGVCTAGTASPPPPPPTTGSPPTNACTVDPCNGHGTCALDATKTTGYQCTCTVGWSGTTCNQAASPCSTNPCANGGSCVAGTTGGYTCSCINGWVGTQCDTPPNPCAPNPCQNGGTCASNGLTYTCACPTGWTGATCASLSAPPPKTPSGTVGTPPTDPFMARLLVLINQARTNAGLPVVSWTTPLTTTANTGLTLCPQYPRTLSGASDALTRVCGFAGDALPGSFADSMFNYWLSYNTWWMGSTIRRVGCAVKAGTACPGSCSGSANWKPLSCVYAAGAAEKDATDFMVSTGDPMLHGHSELRTLDIQFKASASPVPFAAIAVIGLVAAIAVIGIAVAIRRRRAATQQYVEMQEQMMA